MNKMRVETAASNIDEIAEYVKSKHLQRTKSQSNKKRRTVGKLLYLFKGIV